MAILQEPCPNTREGCHFFGSDFRSEGVRAGGFQRRECRGPCPKVRHHKGVGMVQQGSCCAGRRLSAADGGDEIRSNLATDPFSQPFDRPGDQREKSEDDPFGHCISRINGLHHQLLSDEFPGPSCVCANMLPSAIRTREGHSFCKSAALENILSFGFGSDIGICAGKGSPDHSRGSRPFWQEFCINKPDERVCPSFQRKWESVTHARPDCGR